MECTITRLLKDGDRVCGAFGYWRATGEFVVFARAGARARHRRRRQVLADHVELVGVHRRRPCARLRGGRRADRHGVRPVPPHRDGVAARASSACSSPRPCAARAASCATRAASASWSATTRSGWSSRRATSSRARSTPRSRRAAARRTAASSSTSRTCGADDRAAQAAEHVRPVHGARRRRHHARADGGRPDLPLLHGRHPRRRRDRREHGAGPVRRRRVLGRDERRQPARRQLALGPARVRQARRRARGAARRRRAGAARSTTRRSPTPRPR